MLEEYSYPDKIEVLQPSQIVQVRIITEIKKDGDTVASSFFRYTLERGADLASQPIEVVRICEAVWV